jgi:hypothetical protein
VTEPIYVRNGTPWHIERRRRGITSRTVCGVALASPEQTTGRVDPADLCYQCATIDVGLRRPMRGRGPAERRLSDVSIAIDRVRSSALDAAYRNEAKPHWRTESRETLALYLGEECGELFQALRRGTLDDVVREAGDLVWAVAMLVDRESALGTTTHQPRGTVDERDNRDPSDAE